MFIMAAVTGVTASQNVPTSFKIRYTATPSQFECTKIESVRGIRSMVQLWSAENCLDGAVNLSIDDSNRLRVAGTQDCLTVSSKSGVQGLLELVPCNQAVSKFTVRGQALEHLPSHPSDMRCLQNLGGPFGLGSNCQSAPKITVVPTIFKIHFQVNKDFIECTRIETVNGIRSMVQVWAPSGGSLECIRSGVSLSIDDADRLRLTGTQECLTENKPSGILSVVPCATATTKFVIRGNSLAYLPAGSADYKNLRNLGGPYGLSSTPCTGSPACGPQFLTL